MEPVAIQSSQRQVRYVQADAQALGRLARLLGLDRFEQVGLALDAAEVIASDLRVHVVWDRVGQGWFRIVEGRNESRFCASTHVSILFEGREVTRPFAVLMRRIAMALRGRTVEDLLAEVVPATGEVPSDPQQRTPIHTWAIADAWRLFLCDHAVQRKFFETFSFEGPSLYLMHGDLECRFITPSARVRLPRFFNYPWALAAEANYGEGSAATDLDDLDVIQGGQQKLDETLRRCIERIGDRGPILVNSTCVPIVIGDDIDAVIAAHQNECPKSIYHVGPRTIQPVDIFMQYVEDEKKRALADRRRVAGSVALVGFRDVTARDELAAFLEGASIPVTGCLLPGVSPERMRRVLEAEVLVFNPSVYHTPLYRRVFANVEAVRLEPPGPWGLEGSRRWLREVAGAAGHREAMEQRLLDWERQVRSRIEALQARARKLVLGFVVNPESVSRLYDPQSVTGLPIVPVVHELGFRVRIAVFAADRVAWARASQRLQEALAGLEHVEVVGFDTRDDLDAILSDPALRAVYTEFFYDDRLTRRGKGQFSAREFEFGLDGAIRSLERLLAIAELPFYRAYAPYLTGRSDSWWWR